MSVWIRIGARKLREIKDCTLAYKLAMQGQSPERVAIIGKLLHCLSVRKEEAKPPTVVAHPSEKAELGTAMELFDKVLHGQLFLCDKQTPSEDRSNATCTLPLPQPTHCAQGSLANATMADIESWWHEKWYEITGQQTPASVNSATWGNAMKDSIEGNPETKRPVKRQKALGVVRPPPPKIACMTPPGTTRYVWLMKEYEKRKLIRVGTFSKKSFRLWAYALVLRQSRKDGRDERSARVYARAAARAATRQCISLPC